MVCAHSLSETMQRLLPLFIGVLTITLFGGIGLIFWGEGRTYWAAFFAGLTVLRLFMLIRQTLSTFGHHEEFED